MPGVISHPRARNESSPPGRLGLLACVLLTWSVTAGDSRAQDAPGTSPASADDKVKSRPRLFGRLFKDRAPATPAASPLPPLPALDPAGAGVATVPAARPSRGPSFDPAVVPTQGGVAGNEYSYLNVQDVSVGSEADLGFARRLFNAYRDEPTEPLPEDPNAAPTRRAMPAPFKAPPMPFSDFIGPLIGVNDTSVFPLMDALYKGPNGQAWKDSRIKITGWADPSYNASTSRRSNAPLSYAIVPNQLELSQMIVIFERVTDTVQQDHFDWGFRFTNLYGIDYRYTTGKGYFSNQLLKHNHLYGYDPLQMQLDLYFPHIAEGTILRIGRYISPLDIEAQLSPENFLYTHSNMYSVDPYTFTGIQAITKLDDNFTLMLGIHGGNDVALWTTSTQVNGEVLLRWVAPNNKDSLFGGIDSIGHGYYKNGHDDLQVFGFTWSHKFNDRFSTMTEQYYIWQRNALAGGTVVNGTPQPYFEGTGPGKLIRGLSDSYGVVNYTSYVLSDKSLLVFRSDCLADFQGQRTGIAGAYFEHTLGLVHHLSSWAIIRPEVRFDYTSGQKGYDNGTRREQFTFATDLIIRF